MGTSSLKRRVLASAAVGALLVPLSLVAAPSSADEGCAEDGFLLFAPGHIFLGGPSYGVSDGVHNHIEPLLTDLGLGAVAPPLHDLNCGAVEPVEDAVDAATVPLVTALLGG